MPAIGRDDIMPGLRAAVETDDGARVFGAGEEIDNCPLSAVAEGEVHDEDGGSWSWRGEVSPRSHEGTKGKKFGV